MTTEKIFADKEMKKAMENLVTAISNCNSSSARLAALAIDEAKFHLFRKGINDKEYSNYMNKVIEKASVFEEKCTCNKK